MNEPYFDDNIMEDDSDEQTEECARCGMEFGMSRLIRLDEDLYFCDNCLEDWENE